jgi:cell division septal protein FtsQ
MVRKKKKPVRGNKKRHALSPAKRLKRALGVTVKLLVIVIGIPVLIYGGYRLYGELLVYPRLDIKNINVGAMAKVGPEEIKRLSNIEEGQNILSVDLNSGARAIETHPWIKSAVISRHIPNTINIEVVERKPLCLVSMDFLYVADEDGIIFKKYSPEDDLDLVLISGLESAMDDGGKVLGSELVELVHELNRRDGFNLDMISEIHYDRVFGFSFYTLDKGVRLSLGTSRIDEKLMAFEDVSESMGGRIKNVTAMDVSNEDKVVVKLRTL